MKIHGYPQIFAVMLLLIGSVCYAQKAPDASNPDGDIFVLQNAPIASILDEFEFLSGKHLVRDSSLAGLPNLTINGNGMSKPDFLKFIQYSLQLNGVTMVPLDEKTIKVIGPSGIKTPKNEGIPIYTRENDLPDDDSLVTFCVQLTNISAKDAQSIFTSYTPPHPYGCYVAVEGSQSLIITENANTVHKLLKILQLIDVPPATVDSEFIPLKRANAVDVADTLNKLINDHSSQPSTPAPATPGFPGNPGNPPGYPGTVPGVNSVSGPTERSLIVGSARISADERSNQILIITRPENMVFLRKLVAELDSPSTSSIAHRRALNFVSAQNILSAIVDELSTGKEAEGGQTASQRPSTPSQPVRTNTASAASTSTAGESGSSLQGNPLTPPDQNDVPEVATVGQTKIMADDRSNSIIVFGTPDNVDRVFATIDQLDRRPLQVYLSTVIGQLTLSDNSEFGVDLLQKYLKSNVGGVSSSSILSPNTTGSAAVPEPSSLTSSSAFPILSPGTLGGLTLFGAIGSNLDAYVRALSSTGRFKIVARPSVYTTNNKLALIASGQQVPVPENSLSGYTGSSSTLASSTNIGYKDVVLSLQVIPRVSANHQINLQIQQQNDSIGTSVSIAGNSVPTVNTQLINTEVTVKNRDTVVIGGLISESQTNNTSGVPVLQDIPLLGNLFKDKTKSKTRSELVVLIQPTVIENDDQAGVTSADEIRRSTVGPDSAQRLDDVPVAPLAPSYKVKPNP